MERPPTQEETFVPDGFLRLPNVGLSCYANTALQYLHKPFLHIDNKTPLEGDIAKLLRDIYTIAIISGEQYTTISNQLQKFFSICSKEPEFACTTIAYVEMGDTMQFVDSLMLLLKRTNPTFLDSFVFRFLPLSGGGGGGKIMRCNCGMESSLNDNERQINMLGDGVVSHLLLQDLYLKMTCEGCNIPFKAKVQLPQYMLFRYNSDPKKLVIDNRMVFTVGSKVIDYSLIAIASSSGAHATCYVSCEGKQKKDWYSFSDYYYSEVTNTNDHYFVLKTREKPLGFIYAQQGKRDEKNFITAQEIVQMMQTHKVAIPQDLGVTTFPEQFKPTTGGIKCYTWDELKPVTTKFFNNEIRSMFSYYDSLSINNLSMQHSASFQNQTNPTPSNTSLRSTPVVTSKRDTSINNANQMKNTNTHTHTNSNTNRTNNSRGVDNGFHKVVVCISCLTSWIYFDSDRWKYCPYCRNTLTQKPN